MKRGSPGDSFLRTPGSSLPKVNFAPNHDRQGPHLCTWGSAYLPTAIVWDAKSGNVGHRHLPLHLPACKHTLPRFAKKTHTHPRPQNLESHPLRKLRSPGAKRLTFGAKRPKESLTSPARKTAKPRFGGLQRFYGGTLHKTSKPLWRTAAPVLGRAP